MTRPEINDMPVLWGNFCGGIAHYPTGAHWWRFLGAAAITPIFTVVGKRVTDCLASRFNERAHVLEMPSVSDSF